MCVNGLVLRLHVTLNVEHETVNVKLCKFILCCVKQCKCKTNTFTLIYATMWNNVRKCGFYLEREEGFHNSFVIGQPNGPLQKKKTHQNICGLGAPPLL